MDIWDRRTRWSGRAGSATYGRCVTVTRFGYSTRTLDPSASTSVTRSSSRSSPDGKPRRGRDVWEMRDGDEVRVFDTDFGPIGINICYEVEFPIVARRQAEAGARRMGDA